MKKLLLLHERFTPDDCDLWRAAIRRGWATERTNKYKVSSHIEGYNTIRYYGNTLHVEFIKDQLPITFTPIDYSTLANLRPYTKRFITYVTFNRLIQPIENKLFIKPAREKWFEAKVYNPGDVINGTPLAGDEIYISDAVKFIDEVRCFVLDGEVLTSSLYRINSVVWDQAEERPEKINFDERIRDTDIPRMVKEICTLFKFPRGIVIDFGLLENGEWALIEFNEAWASGLYYCKYEKCFDVVIASQEDK